METKRKALLAEELGNLYSNSNIFVVFLKEQEPTPSSNQSIRISMRGTYSGILTYLPHTWSLHC
jgi:hypothetical protein